MSVIKVQNISKHFDSLKAVDDLSFEVQAGQVFGFLGQNGSGKSTTIRMLLSLIHPTSGSIELFGKRIEKNREEILEQVGAIIERPDLYPYLSAKEHLQLFAKVRKQKIGEAAINATLEKVGLAHRAQDKVQTFSLGMKQRLGIGIALVHNPSLIILDEPTNGLDPQGIADIRQLIQYLAKEEGKTVLEAYCAKKKDMPLILTTDPVSRYYNMGVGQICKIIRSSSMTCDAPFYRIVVRSKSNKAKT
jgi:ABC-type multidrug transport system ATPase subunit